MEVAVMSLSTREQQALDSIESRLVGSAPHLAGLLATFTQLNSGERMPAREEVHGKTGWTKRVGRVLAAYARLDRGMALLWVVIAIGLITVGVALSSTGKGGACVTSWEVTCAATHVSGASVRLAG
jgi:hypothetical protein